MITVHNQSKVSEPGNNRLLTYLSPETMQILTLSDQKGWHFNLLGQAQLPKEPVQLDQWLIVPADQDSSEIPIRSYKKIQALFSNGIRPKGFVVVHEAPRLLKAPKVTHQYAPPEQFPQGIEKPKSEANPTDALASIVTSTLLGTFLTIFGTIFMGIAMIDPIIVAVMEDGCWVEIDRWETKI